MSASGGKASGAAHGQMSLKGLKNYGPTRRIEPKAQEIKGDGHLPWPAANYSDHPKNWGNKELEISPKFFIQFLISSLLIS